MLAGYHGCSKCIQEGEFINCVTFPELGCALRTDESFKAKQDEDHHIRLSELELLGIGMVSQVPLDYMHLVCLGVFKRIMQFWYKGRQNIRIPSTKIIELTDLILKFKNYIPQEFARKPRKLSDIDRFKATELRQLLLYTGIVGFKNFVSTEFYNHFLQLSCAIRILASPNLCVSLNDVAKNLFHKFIRQYDQLYGYEYISYNVHNLSHLCEDVKLHGPVDYFSAFPGEAFMSHIKKIVLIQENPFSNL